ncbi:MAG: T9SS type A sorting domain-containing protein [Bacteroidales bacterium]|nr:T9SS type A sorting domain-containing protein [Bacteroidales bacterium]
MKNKILPLSLVTLVIGLGAFLISATVSFPDSFVPFDTDYSGGEEIKSSERYLAKLRNNQLSGMLNPSDVINARMQAEKNAAQNATREDFEWSFLGPDNVGGRTRALLFDNTDADANTIIAGAVSSGLYKSINAGLTWYKINGETNNLNVSCMAQGPDGIIYVGTGEAFTVQEYSIFGGFNYNGAFIGTGIYKSTDGENFTLLPFTAPVANDDTVAFAYINKIAVNPNNGVVWAATNKGVWYSSDDGGTWNLARVGDSLFLLGPSCDVKIGSDGITAVSVEGLAYISDSGHPNQFVLHSSDTFDLPYENVGRTEFAIAPSNPDILYATVVNTGGGLINVYRSDDRGVHWWIIAPGGSQNLNFFSLDANTSQGQGLYDNVLVVFPDNPDKILLGGIDMWEGLKINETGFFQWTQKSNGLFPPQFFPSYVQNNHHIYVFRPGVANQVFVGHDGGISDGNMNSSFYEFIDRNKTYTTSQFASIGFGGQLKRVLGGGHGSGTQYVNGHGNPASAQNGTQIWSEWFPNGGNGGDCFISIIDPDLFIYSRAPGDFFRRSEDVGLSYSNTFLPGAIQIPNDAYHTPCMYWENFENEFSRDSVDFAAKTELLSGTKVMVRSYNREYPFEYILPVTMNPGDTLRVKDIVSTKFFLGTDNAVWMTFDVLDFGGVPEWFTIANKAKSGFDGQAQSIGMSADANYLFVGTLEGQIYRIANIKHAYDYERADVNSPYCIIATTEIPLINPVTMEQNTQVVTSVYVDQQDPAHVIVTLGNYGNQHYVFQTFNGLDAEPTFTSIQGGLPQMPVYSSIIEMSNQNTAIIGTEMGMYISEDINISSPTWTLVEGSTGKVPIFQLRQQLVAQPEVEISYLGAGGDTITDVFPGTYNYGVIYAATYGRGMSLSRKYEKPVGIFNPGAEFHASSLKVYPNPVSNTATIEYSMDEKADVIIAVFDINGRMVVNEQISQTAGTHQYKLDCSSLPRGTYIARIHTGKTVETGKFIVVH